MAKKTKHNVKGSVKKAGSIKNKVKEFFAIDYDKRKMNRFEIFTSAFLFVFLSSFALIISDEVYGNITATKLYTLLVMFGLWFVIMTIGFIEKIASKSVDSSYFKRAAKNLSVTDIALISYTLIAFLSALLSDYRTVAFIGLPERNEGFLLQLLYISMFFMLSRSYIHNLELKIFAVSSIVVSVLGLLQLHGYYAGKITYDILRYGRSYLTTIGNIDVVSTYLVTPIIIFTVLYCQSKEKFWRLLYLAAAAISFYFSIMIGVRSGYVGMAAAIGFMFPFIAKDRVSASRMFHLISLFLFLAYLKDQISQIGNRKFVLFQGIFTNIMVLGAVAFLLISIAVFFIGQHIEVKKKFIWPFMYYTLAVVAGVALLMFSMSIVDPPERRTVMYILYELGQVLKGNISDDLGSNRIYAWRVIYRFFKEKPILGHGPDTVYNLWMREEYLYSYEKYKVYFDKAHNDYLQVMVTTGILGLVSYFTFQLSLFIRSFKKFDEPLVVALAAAGLCFCVQAFFNIGVPIVSPYGWIIFGMLASTIRKKDDKEAVVID